MGLKAVASCGIGENYSAGKRERDILETIFSRKTLIMDPEKWVKNTYQELRVHPNPPCNVPIYAVRQVHMGTQVASQKVLYNGN